MYVESIVNKVLRRRHCGQITTLKCDNLLSHSPSHCYWPSISGKDLHFNYQFELKHLFLEENLIDCNLGEWFMLYILLVDILGAHQEIFYHQSEVFDLNFVTCWSNQDLIYSNFRMYCLNLCHLQVESGVLCYIHNDNKGRLFDWRLDESVSGVRENAITISQGWR